MSFKKAVLICALSVVFSGTAYSQKRKVGKTVDTDKSIKWEEFDKTSSVSVESIDYSNLQGFWKAYEGVYRFGDIVNGMRLTTPMIVEVKDRTYRRTEKSAFDNFVLDRNLIIRHSEIKSDTGLINKITGKELTITWKDGKNYTRYYYKK